MDNQDGDCSKTGNDEEALFGVKLSACLADQMSKKLEEALAGNVQNLPMMRDPEPLLRRLKESYMLHIDMAESFCSSRLFAIAPFVSSKRREQVLQLLPRHKSAEDIDIPTPEEQKQAILEKQALSIHPLFDGESAVPAKVSQERVDEIKKEMMSLQRRLEKARQQRKSLKKRLHDFCTAGKLCETATQISVANLHESMGKVVTGTAALQGCDNEGKECINRQKRLQEDNEDFDDDILVDVSEAAGKKRKLSLEEKYKNEFQDNTAIDMKGLEEGPHHLLFSRGGKSSNTN